MGQAERGRAVARAVRSADRGEQGGVGRARHRRAVAPKPPAANAGDIDHPCPKPVKLWEWFLDRLTFSPNAVLYEPFSGSGTTIIAAESRGLSVAAVEIDPRYVDVAITRWQNFTGNQAVNEETGVFFPSIKHDGRNAAE
ncbi:MAG: site-specific DNA-methyltransferase [Alphaproteobacteria bacterium]|nr:site-specific DNA-methyltransferase [Alphaproteobacteria bacterium]